MEKVLVALAECCVMSKADKDAEMPTKADDIPVIEAKAVADPDEEGEEED